MGYRCRTGLLCGNSKRALKSIYLVARCMAQSKQVFRLFCTVDMVREMIGEAAAMKLLTIPVSDVTVCNRIADTASDIQQLLPERLKSSSYLSLHLDNSFDGFCLLSVGQ